MEVRLSLSSDYLVAKGSPHFGKYSTVVMINMVAACEFVSVYFVMKKEKNVYRLFFDSNGENCKLPISLVNELHCSSLLNYLFLWSMNCTIHHLQIAYFSGQ